MADWTTAPGHRDQSYLWTSAGRSPADYHAPGPALLSLIRGLRLHAAYFLALGFVTVLDAAVVGSTTVAFVGELPVAARAALR